MQGWSYLSIFMSKTKYFTVNTPTELIKILIKKRKLVNLKIKKTKKELKSLEKFILIFKKQINPPSKEPNNLQIH